MDELIIKKYTDEDYNEWDMFISNSVNGTFLQSRKFLCYHPKDRFIDHSLMVFDKKGNLLAVVPACEIQQGREEKIFFAHKGSTFGGIVFSYKSYKVQRIISIIEKIEMYLLMHDFSLIKYKITPDIFSAESSEVLQFCLMHKGYLSKCDLSLYVELNHEQYDVYKSMSQGKRTDVNNCVKAGMEYREIKTRDEIAEFYTVLVQNLKKYEAKPVHSLEELIDFKENRLADVCVFRGVFLEDKMVAGGMLFKFSDSCVHTQYLCALEEYNKLSPMSFLYYSILCEMKEKEYEIVSWGTSTEDEGKYVNVGLTKSKEAYGSRYSLNRTFEKTLKKEKTE